MSAGARDAFVDRFWSHVSIGDGCWEWRGYLRYDGYGLTHGRGRETTRAHRLAFELVVGPIPAGMVLDHLCLNPACVRPDHLEPVTQGINIKRGIGIQRAAEVRAARTHCKRGHEFTHDNVRPVRSGKGGPMTGRQCKTCEQARPMKGSALECAISRAFVHYEKVGRASAKKQQHIAKMTHAAIDFRGTVAPIPTLEGLAAGGRSLAIECKETAISNFPLNDDKIDEGERLALDTEQRLGALTYLVVEFTTMREVYAVTWDKVQAFIAAPWRASLSLDWFRAHGELVPESDRDDHKRRAAWLLDARPHQFQATAYLSIAAEKARELDRLQTRGETIELFPCERKPSKVDRFAGRPAPGTPEHADYIKQLAIEGQENAMRRAGKPKPGDQFKRRRRGWGSR